MKRIPPIHALVAFEAAVRLGGFAQAAAELCVTPSAVSHRIRQLEEHLGTKLFERTPSGVRLTTAGHMYVESVREAFGKLAWASGGATPVIKLRVSVPPTFARQMLIPRLPDFYRQWPEVELEIHLSIPLQDVTAETADVEIRWGYGGYGDSRAVKLFDDLATPLATPELRARLAMKEPRDIRQATLLRTPLMPCGGRPGRRPGHLARGDGLDRHRPAGAAVRRAGAVAARLLRGAVRAAGRATRGRRLRRLAGRDLRLNGSYLLPNWVPNAYCA